MSTLRVVSLVPSVTETLAAWSIEPVACTRFCERPDLRTVGGTKNPDVAAIVDLDPDVVVVNDEENRREDVAALLAAGVSVHDCSPRSVAAVPPQLAELAVAVGLDGPPEDPTPAAPVSVDLGLRVFVPIWRRPWMALGSDTYGSDLLASLGVSNVLADGDDRYPTLSLGEARARRPDLVLAPSEPYAFGDQHLVELATVAEVGRVDGQDLFWWGVRTASARGRLARALSR